MLSITMLGLVLTVPSPGLTWHSDYRGAYLQAKAEKKDLFIYFRENDRYDDVLADPEVTQRLTKFVCLRVSSDYEHRGSRLLDHDSFEDMLGRGGFVVVSLHDKTWDYYGAIISAHPLVSSRYGWVPDYDVEQVSVILDLPRYASLSQRSMIYAARVHPERPKSVYGQANYAFLAHAAWHSDRQASMNHQHHADLIAASNWISGQIGQGLSSPSEVVAESWGRVVGGENVLEASFSCFDAWRHSSGHWSAVSGYQTYYGYDISRGSNGTWYATGIFAR